MNTLPTPDDIPDLQKAHFEAEIEVAASYVRRKIISSMEKGLNSLEWRHFYNCKASDEAKDRALELVKQELINAGWVGTEVFAFGGPGGDEPLRSFFETMIIWRPGVAQTVKPEPKKSWWRKLFGC